MATISWSDLATTLVAVYGAALATYTLIHDRRDKRRVIVVKSHIAIPVYQGRGAGDPLFMINAVNPGSRTVHLAGAGFRIGRKKGFALFQPQGDVKFPHALEEGKSCSVWLESRDLAQQLMELGYIGKQTLRGYFQDSVGTQYFSKPVKFNVDEWLATRPSAG